MAPRTEFSDLGCPEVSRSIDRRGFLLGGAAIAATALSGSAFAQAGGGHEHHHHHAGSGHGAVVTAALDCVKTGEECLAHCLASFETGDTELAICAERVHELVIACTALGKFAALGSKHLAGMARVSTQVCTDCEIECRKHEHHPQCKACAESCLACIEACKSLLG